MISAEQKAQIRRLHHAEGWRVGTIAKQLGVHHSTVTNALMGPKLMREKQPRASRLTPFFGFLEETLKKYPDLTASRLHQMLQTRGYEASIYPVRRWLKKNRPKPSRVYQDLYFMPSESAQVDWADFGKLEIAPGVYRRLQCFVMVLSYSRQIFAKVFYDQKTCALLEGHEAAFTYFDGVPRRIIYDNMRTAVIINTAGGVTFTDTLCDLASHYNFELTACAPRAAWAKGRVERAIRYLRSSFSPQTRNYKNVEELNTQLISWLNDTAAVRPWPDDPNKTVADAFGEEQGVMLPVANPYPSYEERYAKVSKQSYITFDCNRYSVPPQHVGDKLLLRISSVQLSIYSGQNLLAWHPRCWSKHQKICHPDHIEQIISKTKAYAKRQHRQLIVQTLHFGEELLKRWHQIDENITKQSKMLDVLIASYGQQNVEAAVGLALELDTPRSHSIAQILHDCQAAPRLTAPSYKRKDLAQYTTESHDLQIYDQLQEELR